MKGGDRICATVVLLLADAHFTLAKSADEVVPMKHAIVRTLLLSPSSYSCDVTSSKTSRSVEVIGTERYSTDLTFFFANNTSTRNIAVWQDGEDCFALASVELPSPMKLTLQLLTVDPLLGPAVPMCPALSL